MKALDEGAGPKGEDAASVLEGEFAMARLPAGDQFADPGEGRGFAEFPAVADQELIQDGEVVFEPELVLDAVQVFGERPEAERGGGLDQMHLVEEGLGGGTPGVEGLRVAGGMGGLQATTGLAVARMKPGREDLPTVVMPAGPSEGTRGGFRRANGPFEGGLKPGRGMAGGPGNRRQRVPNPGYRGEVPSRSLGRQSGEGLQGDPGFASRRQGHGGLPEPCPLTLDEGIGEGRRQEAEEGSETLQDEARGMDGGGLLGPGARELFLAHRDVGRRDAQDALADVFPAAELECGDDGWHGLHGVEGFTGNAFRQAPAPESCPDARKNAVTFE